jgi:hypothetical protein
VATGGKWDALENRSNRPIRNRWQPTATVSERMVKRESIAARFPDERDQDQAVRAREQVRRSRHRHHRPHPTLNGQACANTLLTPDGRVASGLAAGAEAVFALDRVEAAIVTALCHGSAPDAC